MSEETHAVESVRDDSNSVVKPTLQMLLKALTDAEDSLSGDDFDPELLVGDVRDKVDAIYMVLGKMEAASAYLKALADPLIRKAKAIENNRQRLRDYVTFTMKASNFVTLPGNAFKVSLREASKPSLIIENPAGPMDFSQFPEFVVMKREYTWNKDAIRQALLEKKPIPVTCIARLETSHYPDFKPAIPEKLETEKKGRKK